VKNGKDYAKWLPEKCGRPRTTRQITWILGFIHGTIEVDGHPIEIDYLVMELLARRTLPDTMDVIGFEYDEEIKTWIPTYMILIIEGLENVHGNGIIRRDIEPENFFMKHNVAKLADFRLSMGFDLPSVTDSVSDIFGTVTYMAREPADIFAIGCILYEIAEGKITEQGVFFKQGAVLAAPGPSDCDIHGRNTFPDCL